jgi:hypothetical protein
MYVVLSSTYLYFFILRDKSISICQDIFQFGYYLKAGIAYLFWDQFIVIQLSLFVFYGLGGALILILSYWVIKGGRRLTQKPFF